ncbi:MAG: hypothetical protein LBG78_01625 [Azoarcus sp.]|nr:hypothetical protein [Azoarcus sp.]
MRKSLFFIAALCAVFLAGCSDSDKPSGDLLHDKAAIKKAVEGMKSAGGGTPLMIYQDVIWDTDYININRQDKDKPTNIDNFTYSSATGWQGPTPVTPKSEAKLEESLFDADKVNWEAIAEFVARVEKEAQEENMEKIKIDNVMVVFKRDEKGIDLKFFATVKGENNEAVASGDTQTGELLDFEIR